MRTSCKNLFENGWFFRMSIQAPMGASFPAWDGVGAPGPQSPLGWITGLREIYMLKDVMRGLPGPMGVIRMKQVLDALLQGLFQNEFGIHEKVILGKGAQFFKKRASGQTVVSYIIPVKVEFIHHWHKNQLYVLLRQFFR
jgi:hypothetical protein